MTSMLICVLVIQEAVATGDPELLRICLEERDIQKRRKRSDLVPILLKRLEDVSLLNNTYQG